MEKSESIINLAKAMAAFQGEVKNPINTASNPFYKSKYAPLNEILNEVRPVMAKHGLSIIQSPGGNGKDIAISTILLHSSGEWMELTPLILTAEKITPQGAGSAITYGRRYIVSALLGIASEDDDDGNSLESTQCQGKTKSDNKQTINCGECFKAITATPRMKVEEIIGFSKKTFGKEMCADCATKKIEEKKAAKKGGEQE